MRFEIKLYRGPAALFAAALSAGGEIIGGIQQDRASKREAALQEQQGQLAYDEAQRNAELEARDQTQFVQQQKMAYLANGVSLEGSPLSVLEESRSYGQKQVQSILDQGAAYKNLMYQSATNTRNKGRAALIGSFFKGAGDIGMGIYNFGQAGGFKSTSFKSGGSFSNTAPYKRPNMRRLG